MFSVTTGYLNNYDYSYSKIKHRYSYKMNRKIVIKRQHIVKDSSTCMKKNPAPEQNKIKSIRRVKDSQSQSPSGKKNKRHHRKQGYRKEPKDNSLLPIQK